MILLQVQLADRTIRLSNNRVIGVGGEATVFEHNGEALKVYTQPSAERDRKLRAMLGRTSGLPALVIAPQQLLTDPSSGDVVGFTMQLLGPGFTEVRQLASKKYRTQSGLTARDVARLFLKAHATLSAVHRAGMVVGDLNDLNLLFKDEDMWFIDVDSFQFDGYPCAVGTEVFIDPVLYGVDLSMKPAFTTDTDWYAFAVLLFKSLLLSHPYGGVHPNVKLLTQRVAGCLSVFDGGVTYPRIAYSLELLSDDLKTVFIEWFAGGQRGVFPVSAIQSYLAALRDCPSCGMAYPSNRGKCPMCAIQVPVAVPATLRMETLVATGGDAIAWDIIGKTVRLLAHKNGKVIYHQVDGHRQPRHIPLFNIMPDASYAFLGDVLVVSPSPGSEALMLVDVNGSEPRAILQTTTDRLGGRQSMFGAGGGALYRLAGHYLMQGIITNGQLVEQAVMSVVPGQTWFAVAPAGNVVFGYFRVFAEQQYWLLVDGNQFRVELTLLDPSEVLLEVDVQFGEKTVLVSRLTQNQGVEHVRVEMVDHRGRRLHALVFDNPDEFAPLGTIAYADYVVLWATDSGITQLRLDNAMRRVFPQTEPVARRGDPLLRYDKGLAVRRDNRLLYVTT